MTGRDISVYVHVPFCSTICPYCNFYVEKVTNLLVFDKFVDAVVRQIYQNRNHLSSSNLVSIYFGGGTPSLLLQHQLSAIIDVIYKYSKTIDPNIEITLEANPDSIDEEYLHSISDTNINRLSIGVQSFDNFELKKAGRTHTSKQACESILLAKKYVETVSIDLMYELPHQTFASVANTVDILDSIDCDHISLYNMTIDEGSAFYKRKEKVEKTLPSEKESEQIFALLDSAITSKGLTRYEISAYAKNGKKAVHNTRYWRCQDVLAIGPSGCGYLNGVRYQNIVDYHTFCNEDTCPIVFSESLTPEKRAREHVAVGLRLFEGVNVSELFKDISLDGKKSIMKDVSQSETLGYIHEKSPNVYSLTSHGKKFYNDVASLLI